MASLNEQRVERMEFLMKSLPKDGIPAPVFIDAIIRLFGFTNRTAREYADSMVASGRVKLLNGYISPKEKDVINLNCVK